MIGFGEESACSLPLLVSPSCLGTAFHPVISYAVASSVPHILTGPTFSSVGPVSKPVEVTGCFCKPFMCLGTTCFHSDTSSQGFSCNGSLPQTILFPWDLSTLAPSRMLCPLLSCREVLVARMYPAIPSTHITGGIHPSPWHPGTSDIFIMQILV